MAKIVLSAGGTGGHLFPAEALAQELLARGHKVTIITDKRGHAFKTLGEDVAIHTVRAATLKPGILTKLKAIIDMGLGILSAIRLLRRIGPNIVVGFGGYPSFPGVFAAQQMGIRTAIHEQNAVMGKANLWLANGARMIALSFPGTKGITERNQNKTVDTGNPVRQSIIDISAAEYVSSTEDFRILITGGSQAASIFSAVVPEALALMPQDLRARSVVAHQCREADIGGTAQKYTEIGVRAEVKTFFPDIAKRIEDCHLFIGRSGASTVTEIAIAGRPAIFIPLRHADMQQKYNAEVLTKVGGGWLIMQENFTPERLATELTQMMREPFMLEKAALTAKTCGRPEAARKLAEAVEKAAVR
jgi:UDP-N-acetylglucosamine--N-acetylmuramyl-(pentapeptide) pyrophosphoryl-undecaprenol N-acetylglucosamine transferase